MTEQMGHYEQRVRHFRNLFGMKQGEEVHDKLFFEELDEYQQAKCLAEKADALADMMVVLVCAECEGFQRWQRISAVFDQAEAEGIDLKKAFDIVMDSNMTKLVKEDEIEATEAKYALIGVPVMFKQVGESLFSVYSLEDSTGSDGKEYPAGKLLKSSSYREQDWSGTEWISDCRV